MQKNGSLLMNYQWQLHQYLVAIDEGYDNELEKLTADPHADLPMDTASVETRNCSNKLCSLLASLIKSTAKGGAPPSYTLVYNPQ